MNAIKFFDLLHWNGPMDASIRNDVIDFLESGGVVALPQLAFALLPE